MSGTPFSPDAFSEYGPTFCVLPWLHLATRPDGHLLPCANATELMTDEKGAPLHLSRHKFSEAWQGDYLHKMRRKLLAGERLSGCGTCYHAESAGKMSLRHAQNWWWKEFGREEIHQRVRLSQSENAQFPPPRSLDLRLGRSCNLSCRSCSAGNSTFLEAEWNRLLAEDPAFREFWISSKVASGEQESPSWQAQEEQLREIRAMLPYIRQLYLTGGESMLVKGNYELIRTCVREGYASGIELMISTNLTTYSKEIYDSFSHFRMVHLHGSIDGFGRLNEYLRYPSKWSVVDSNLKKALNTKGRLNIMANVVVQYHNALRLPELLRYFDELNSPGNGHLHKLRFHFMPLEQPEWLAFSLLPRGQRLEAIAELQEYARSSPTCASDPYSRNSVDSLIALLEREPGPGAEELRAKNLRYTRCFDDFRGVKLADVAPELAAATLPPPEAFPPPSANAP